MLGLISAPEEGLSAFERRIPYPDSAEGLTQSRSARSPLFGAKAAPHPFRARACLSAAVSTASERASPSSAFVRQGLCTAIMSNEVTSSGIIHSHRLQPIQRMDAIPTRRRGNLERGATQPSRMCRTARPKANRVDVNRRRRLHLRLPLLIDGHPLLWSA